VLAVSHLRSIFILVRWAEIDIPLEVVITFMLSMDRTMLAVCMFLFFGRKTKKLQSYVMM